MSRPAPTMSMYIRHDCVPGTTRRCSRSPPTRMSSTGWPAPHPFFYRTPRSMPTANHRGPASFFEGSLKRRSIPLGLTLDCNRAPSVPAVGVLRRVATTTQLHRPPARCRSHNYIGHNYIGRNCTGRTHGVGAGLGVLPVAVRHGLLRPYLHRP